jgi:hypothetical protein
MAPVSASVAWVQRRTYRHRKEVIMPGFPFDKPLDGRVGNIEAPDEPAAVAGAAGTTETTQPTLWVSVTGDGISDPALLSEELKFVIAKFVHNPGKAAWPRAPDSDTHGDIAIAAHGLNLNPADQQRLRRLIVERIRAHTEGGDAGKRVRTHTLRGDAGKRVRAQTKRGGARK